MRNTQSIFVIALLALIMMTSLAIANSGDFDGGVAVGSGYAGINTAPTSGLIVQGDVGIGTSAPSQQLVVNGNADVMGTNGYLTEIANASSTGTTVNKLAKLTGTPSTALLAATTDTDGIVGIVIGGAGTTGNAQIAINGQASCIFENATTAGDYVTIGSTTAGDCHDYGSTRPATEQTIGRVLASVSSGSSATVALSIGGTGVSSNQWTASGSDIYYNTGNVGIGTSSPSTALQVNGTITASGISTSTFVAPTVQQFTSGSGTYTTPTSPRSPLYIRVRMVGGGGGGAGAGPGGGTAGGDGGTSTFGTSLLSADGGQGGQTNGGASYLAGNGGTASLGGASGRTITGGGGGGGSYGGGQVGGAGGNSALGGGAPGGGGASSGTGASGGANTGGGGGGAAPGGLSFSGFGGGAGGYVEAIIPNPAASYSYSVGTGGTAGTNTINGGAGGSGDIYVEEYYQ